jgi:hypothetical protein
VYYIKKYAQGPNIIFEHILCIPRYMEVVIKDIKLYKSELGTTFYFLI